MNSETSDLNHATTSEGMPGLRGAEHVGFTVPDIEAAVRFFRDVLGCKEYYDLGEFGAEEGDWMRQILMFIRAPRSKPCACCAAAMAAISNFLSMNLPTKNMSSRATPISAAITLPFISTTSMPPLRT